jgi:hypothetical protein
MDFDVSSPCSSQAASLGVPVHPVCVAQQGRGQLSWPVTVLGSDGRRMQQTILQQLRMPNRMQ